MKALVGNLFPTVEFPVQVAVTRQITVQGSYAPCGEYPACLAMIANGKINVDVLISQVAPVDYLVARIPLKRPRQPHDLDGAIVFQIVKLFCC